MQSLFPPLGIFLLFIGLACIVYSFLKLTFTGSKTAKSIHNLEIFMLIGGIISMVLGIILMKFSEGTGIDRVSVGIFLLLIAGILLFVWCWHEFWSGLVPWKRKSKLFLLGLSIGLFLLGLIIILLPQIEIPSGSETGSSGVLNIQEIFNKPFMFGLPFGIFAFGFMFAVNVAALKNKRAAKEFIWINITAIFALCFLYFIIPKVLNH